MVDGQLSALPCVAKQPRIVLGVVPSSCAHLASGACMHRQRVAQSGHRWWLAFHLTVTLRCGVVGPDGQ